METEERKKCSRCGVEFPLRFFHKHRRKVHNGYVVDYDNICKFCRSAERLAKRDANPFRPKARATLSYHARREGLSVPQFVHRYGVDVDYIEMLFRDAWILSKEGGRCHSCGYPFDDDLSKFHLDKIFPNLPPTRANLRVICEHCNNGKGVKDPIEYDLESLEYDRGRKAVQKGVQFDLPERKSKTPPKNTQLALFNNVSPFTGGKVTYHPSADRKAKIEIRTGTCV